MLMVLLGIPRYIYMNFCGGKRRAMETRKKVMHVWAFVSVLSLALALSIHNKQSVLVSANPPSCVYLHKDCLLCITKRFCVLFTIRGKARANENTHRWVSV
jgi:hypothetical protein